MGLGPQPRTPPASIQLSTIIMGVPERMDRIKALRPKLDDADAIVDVNHRGTVETAMCALGVALEKHGTTHVLIVEDDAEPCADFLAGVRKALGPWPDDVVSFWSAQNGEQERRAARTGSHWIKWQEWYGTVAVALPVAVAAGFFLWCASDYRRGYIIGRAEAQGAPQDQLERYATAWDMWLRAFVEDRGVPTWHTFPSLVQHGEPDTTTAGSALDKWLRPARTSAHYIGADVSALTIRRWAVR